MDNPFNTPSLWDVPLVQSFQSIAEMQGGMISKEFYTHSVCLTLCLVCFIPTSLLLLLSTSLFSPFLYLSLTKSLPCLFCWGLQCRETEWQKGVRVCRCCIRLSNHERVWSQKKQGCFFLLINTELMRREAQSIWFFWMGLSGTKNANHTR